MSVHINVIFKLRILFNTVSSTAFINKARYVRHFVLEGRDADWSLIQSENLL
jgi:hypothetical protein